jgi:hypothetical protein
MISLNKGLLIKVKSAEDKFDWTDPVLIDAAGFNGTILCKTNENKDSSLLNRLPW